MRRTLFLLFLCFFLLKGADYAHAVLSAHSSFYPPVQKIEISRTAQSVAFNGYGADNLRTAIENKQFLIEDLDDDKADNFFVKKFIMVANYYSTPAFPTTLAHPLYYSKADDCFGQSSNKFFRVLRV